MLMLAFLSGFSSAWICFINYFKALTYSLCTCTVYFLLCVVTLFRMSFLTGDTLSVVAKICNSSSKKMKPKISLQQKIEYRASGSTKSTDQSLCKMVGETVALNAEETVSCQMKVPDDVTYTILNCEIISVDYYLKVCNDVIVIQCYIS